MPNLFKSQGISRAASPVIMLGHNHWIPINNNFKNLSARNLAKLLHGSKEVVARTLWVHWL